MNFTFAVYQLSFSLQCDMTHGTFLSETSVLGSFENEIFIMLFELWLTVKRILGVHLCAIAPSIQLFLKKCLFDGDPLVKLCPII